MDKFTLIMYSNISYYFLASMIVAALFFAMAGIRELKHQCMEGLLYLTIAMFFIAAHILFLFNIPIDNSLSYITSKLNIWIWLIIILAPSLIFLFVSFGIVNFLINNTRLGLVKIFFGLSLLCYLFMLGNGWSVDLKGIITFLFCFAWFEVELSTAQ